MVGQDTVDQLVSDHGYSVEYSEGPPISLVTANGVAQKVTKRATIWIPQLIMEILFVLLPKCPMAISLGRLLKDNMWDMVWRASVSLDPIILDSDHNPILIMKEHRFCPFFQDYDPECSWITEDHRRLSEAFMTLDDADLNDIGVTQDISREKLIRVVRQLANYHKYNK